MTKEERAIVDMVYSAKDGACLLDEVISSTKKVLTPQLVEMLRSVAADLQAIEETGTQSIGGTKRYFNLLDNLPENSLPERLRNG